MKALIRLMFLMIAVALVVFGFARERHKVLRLDGGAPADLSGMQYVEGSTYDSYMLREGKLYDVYSLSPLSASEKDCKT